MNIKSLLAKPFANVIYRQIQKERNSALEDQQSILNQLVKSGKSTIFGKEHKFDQINSPLEFQEGVPLRDYEAFKTYIEQIKKGTQNVLWKGKPIYFAKTSGTTSGVKYIPITKDSISNHINGARNALLTYMATTGENKFVNGRMIFLSGSPVLERVAGIPTGRLSGIVNHHIPAYLRSNQLPSYETNCIEEWEEKLDRIVAETILKDMTLVGGIPPWMQMYFDRIVEKSGKSVKEVFPNLQVLVQGGVNFEPYQSKLFDTIGKSIDTIELFPASEGFFAFQDTRDQQGLLLNTNSGIYFEFIPLAHIQEANPKRLNLSQVELGVQYALVINSNAGLWGYHIGDTVKFVSIDPYRLIVTGRVKHFISAFGEHVIGEEVEYSLNKALEEFSVSIREFTVAPHVSQDQNRSCHEWFIEFDKAPESLAAFSNCIDLHLRKKNVYYDDLIKGNILGPLQIIPVQKGGFVDYMRSIGKLGGQNKVPRLSNDRKIADALTSFTQNNTAHS